MKALKITEHTRPKIERMFPKAAEQALYAHDNCYIVTSMNFDRLEYPFMIWTEEQFKKYYSFVEPEKYNQFTKVTRTK